MEMPECASNEMKVTVQTTGLCGTKLERKGAFLDIFSVYLYLHAGCVFFCHLASNQVSISVY